MSELKETKTYNINDFLNWYDNGELTISPKYQRNPVWNLKAKSYLIDSILRGLPISQIFIRQIVDIVTRKTFREVIDGQQRLRAIIEFINDEFSIMKSHNKQFANMKYSDLDDKTKEDILLYDLPVEIIKSQNDAVIYNMFARLNTNSISLNKQEIRNAIYWGEFKVFVFELAEKVRPFFIEINTFKDNQLSRMNDIEFVSSLIIVLIDGVITESATVLDNYYKTYDEEFLIVSEIETKILKIFTIMELVYEKTGTKYLHRKSYFYTLFCFLANQMFGIDNLKIDKNNNYSESNIKENLNNLIPQISNFESNLDRSMNNQLCNNAIKDDMIKFEKNHRTRTTSQKERIERISIINKYLIK